MELIGKSLEALAVLNCQLWVVERAGPDHDEETVIFLGDDAGGFLATLNDSLLGMCGNGDLGCEELGWDQRVVPKYCTVILVLVGGGGSGVRCTAHVVARVGRVIERGRHFGRLSCSGSHCGK